MFGVERPYFVFALGADPFETYSQEKNNNYAFVEIFQPPFQTGCNREPTDAVVDLFVCVYLNPLLTYACGSIVLIYNFTNKFDGFYTTK